MKHTILSIFTISAIMVLTGCSSGTITVRNIVDTNLEVRYTTAHVVRKTSTISVDKAVEDKFYTIFSSKMAGDFATGNDFTVEYRFIKFDKGNQAVRYLIGFGAGKGEMAVEAKFMDSEGNHLGTVESEGEISIGLFGGSFDTALEEAAKELHAFAVQKFKQ